MCDVFLASVNTMQLIIYLYVSSVLIITPVFSETPKRAPPGFSAVRGKKSGQNYKYLEPNYIANLQELLRNEKPSLILNKNEYYPLPDFKNNDELDSEWIRVGVGMSKDRGQDLWNGEDDYSFEKRSPYGFVGVRGKKYSPEIIRSSDELQEKPDSDVSLRKKKEVEVFQYDGKRTPFLGMRGKKEKYLSYYKSRNQFDDKRAPMGFIGMRGKKSIDGWNTDYKTG